MVNDQLIKDMTKALDKSDLGGSKELDPGSTPRRYEPNGGIKKHNERIHKESNHFDKHGDLPFSFSAPPKSISGRRTTVQCDNCGAYSRANKNTISKDCRECNTWAPCTQVEG